MRYLQSMMVVFGLMASSTTLLLSQQTAKYYDPQADYLKALELFDHHQYGNASDVFGEIIDQTLAATDQEVLAIKSNAEYYRAICALKLLTPDGEHLLSEFLRKYPSHLKSNLAHFHLGSHHYATRNYRGAIKEFEQVDPRELSASEREDYKFKSAYAYFFRQNFVRAKPLFAELRSSKKYYYPAHYYHGFILFEQKRYDEAIADLRKVEEDTRFGRVVPFYIASIYFEQRKYDQLLEYATPLLDDKHQHYYTELNQLLGKAWFEKSNYEKALPYLEYYDKYTSKVTKEDLFQLGYVYYKTGRYEDAIERFSELNREDNALGQHAMYLLADCSLKLNDKRRARTGFLDAANADHDATITESALFHYAKLSYELGFHSPASSALQDFLARYPESPFSTEAKELLTELLVTTKNYKEAIAVIETIEPKTPRIRAAYQKVACFRGMELYENSQLGQAQAHFNKSLQYPVDDGIEAMCHYWLGEIAFFQNNNDEAIREYQKFLSLEQVGLELPAESSRATASYGLGYAHLKKENYASAVTYFEQAVSELNSFPADFEHRAVKERVTPDLTVRLADGYFMVNKKEQALSAYSDLLGTSYSNKDYAHYQRGMLHGIMGNNDAKIADMKAIVRNYPRSLYADDAQYQLANTYFLKNQYTQAINEFEKVLNTMAGSVYVVRSLQKLGLIYYNLKDYDRSVSYYKTVAENYPNTPESRDALERVKVIVDETGRVDLYEKMPGANIATSDSLNYRQAEKLYAEENYTAAKRAFSDYLSKFPRGYYVLDARYYRGDCLYRDKDYDQALSDYEFITGRSRTSQYSETAFLRAAKIRHYHLNDFSKAFDHYRNLLATASFKQNTIVALKGLLYTSYELKRYNDTKSYARQLIAESQVETDLLIDAHYYLAKIAYGENDLETAKVEFTKTSELTSNEKGAESRYYIAEIFFKRGQIAQAEAACDDLVKTISFDYWLAKSYILIADIYVEKDELLQAQATLQSLVDNYRGDADLQAEARRKLDNVNNMLASRSRIRSPGDLYQDPR